MPKVLQAGIVPCKPKRVAISKRRRFEILKRDRFTCQYCGAHPPNVLLHVDHIKPVAEGGGNHDDNLITACEPCNQGKGAVPLSSVPENLSSKAARVAEAEAQLAAYNEILASARDRLDAQVWEVVEELTGRDEIDRPKYLSILNFVEALGVEPVRRAALVARSKLPWSDRRAFLYMCKTCWNMIGDAS